MLSIIGSLLGLAPSLLKIGDQIAAARKAQADALTDRERIAAEERVKTLELQRDLAIAASQNDRWWSTRELIGKCVLIVVFKLLIWDTVLKLGVTPDPGPKVWWVVVVVIGFYFGSKSAERIADTLAMAFVRKK